jgi:hypothetical protein
LRRIHDTATDFHGRLVAIQNGKLFNFLRSLNVSFTDMLSILNDSQKAIVETMTMRLNTKQSLEYLKEHGYEMSERTFFRQKKKIEDLKLKRLFHIAKIGFEDQHMERIDNCEIVLKKLWEHHEACEDVYKKAKILEIIINMQPYLSTYYEATHFVVKEAEDKNIVP